MKKIRAPTQILKGRQVNGQVNKTIRKEKGPDVWGCGAVSPQFLTGCPMVMSRTS